ncbi:MAG: glycoside hydrolase [Spirochaetaceae bacterium]|jgi:spore germination protein YaaH|nr:glycoside hydrolase [Spirochaetaceae bacterium]
MFKVKNLNDLFFNACLIFCAQFVLCAFASCRSRPVQTPVLHEIETYASVETPPFSGVLPQSDFDEVWGYVVAGNEKSLKQGLPLSDVVYFGAAVDRYGDVADAPQIKNLPKFSGRVHMSIICESAGLTHFILEPESRARERFINELLKAAEPFYGLNIDMESVPVKDADNFLSFLKEIRKRLGGRMLSVCVPARTSANQTYNYEKISAVSDRVFVMAYDEHWSGSRPGPVASMNWCKSVAEYSLKTIGPKKLIMGLPFYGRSWGDKAVSRALVHSTVENIHKENGSPEIERENGVPKFKYNVVVNVTVYFEDAYSIGTRMDMYQKAGVKYVGFWRLGQETNDVWKTVNLRTAKN